MQEQMTAVIPARYASTRLPGKPLRDIHGRPMIWWVWNTVRRVRRFDTIVVATEDERVVNACTPYGIDAILTSAHDDSRISRLHEVSRRVAGDRFVCVNGDEPAIRRDLIEGFVDAAATEFPGAFFLMGCSTLTDPTQVADFSKIKVVTDERGKVVYLSRSPIPYPRGTSHFRYKRSLGLECFSREALDFFAATPMPDLERIEDIDTLRFIEHGKPIQTIELDAGEIVSVDTEKDLQSVRAILGGGM